MDQLRSLAGSKLVDTVPKAKVLLDSLVVVFKGRFEKVSGIASRLRNTTH